MHYIKIKWPIYVEAEIGVTVVTAIEESLELSKYLNVPVALRFNDRMILCNTLSVTLLTAFIQNT